MDISTRSLSFYFNDTATTDIYTLSLHDALPIWHQVEEQWLANQQRVALSEKARTLLDEIKKGKSLSDVAREQQLPLKTTRSEEHTSELQSRFDLVCRLLLEKKKKKRQQTTNENT